MKLYSCALSAAVLVAVLFTTRGHGASCGDYSSCQACLADDGCVYVLGRLPAESDNRFLCVNHTASRSVAIMTTYAKFRRAEDCEHVGDVSEPPESGTAAADGEILDMMANLEQCPLASPLLIAFFVTSLLLAISVTVMCTIFCWPIDDGDKRIKTYKAGNDEKNMERSEAREHFRQMGRDEDV